jgi:hypothetical protein
LLETSFLKSNKLDSFGAVFFARPEYGKETLVHANFLSMIAVRMRCLLIEDPQNQAVSLMG